MAVYKTKTKIIKYSHAHVRESFPADDDFDTAGSLAKEINDYVVSLDSGTETIINIHSVYNPTSNSTFTIIVHDIP